MVMIFAHPQPREFLLKEGHVFSFRIHDHKVGKDWITDKRGGKKICDVEIRLAVTEFPTRDLVETLKAFAPHSGFASVDEWRKAIIDFYLDGLPEKGYIFSIYTKEGWMKQFGELRNKQKETVGFIHYGFNWKSFSPEVLHVQWIIAHRFTEPRTFNYIDPYTAKQKSQPYILHMAFETNNEIYVRES